MITRFNLVAAGTHRGKAIVDDLIAAKQAGEALDDVVWDPGYSLCKPGTVHHRLAKAGIHQTFQPVTHQRGRRPFSGDAVLIDGQLFSNLVPDELRDLPAPPRGASEAEKQPYEAKFNLRARWRMMRHAGPDVDGATRWRCPFCTGFLRCRAFPPTMRRAQTVPLVVAPEGVSRYNTVVSEPDLWIEPAARRHGVSDDDIRHALAHPGYVGDDPDALDDDTSMTLILGPDRAGNRLELAALVADDGTVVVVHAMPMRAKYAQLWPRERRTRR
ncbi:MAG: hypothetical protein ACYCUG_06165 [Acidimicrobiales bacterium]